MLPEAPSWLGYVAPAVAVLALLASLSSYRLSKKTYERAGPKVKVAVTLLTDWDPTTRMSHSKFA